MRSDYQVLKSTEVLWRECADGTLTLLNTSDAEKYFIVSGLMAEVWRFIDGRRTARDISDRMTRIARSPQRGFEGRILRSLQELKSRGLVKFKRLEQGSRIQKRKVIAGKAKAAQLGRFARMERVNFGSLREVRFQTDVFSASAGDDLVIYTPDKVTLT